MATRDNVDRANTIFGDHRIDQHDHVVSHVDGHCIKRRRVRRPLEPRPRRCRLLFLLFGQNEVCIVSGTEYSMYGRALCALLRRGTDFAATSANVFRQSSLTCAVFLPDAELLIVFVHRKHNAWHATYLPLTCITTLYLRQQTFWGVPMSAQCGYTKQRGLPSCPSCRKYL